jgi:hypothetical protein
MDPKILTMLLNHGTDGFITASAGRGKQGMNVEEITSDRSLYHASWLVSRLKRVYLHLSEV